MIDTLLTMHPAAACLAVTGALMFLVLVPAFFMAARRRRDSYQPPAYITGFPARRGSDPATRNVRNVVKLNGRLE